jgi:hypothetical protein
VNAARANLQGFSRIGICEMLLGVRFLYLSKGASTVIRKLALGIAGVSLAVAVGIGFNPSNAWATAGKRVDCEKVMAEVHAGKKTKEIATELKISNSSVYRCKKKAAASAAKSTSKVAPGSKRAPVAASMPAH